MRGVRYLKSMQQVDVNNTPDVFNSAEDKVQLALGVMQLYTIKIKNDYTYETFQYPGIIALTHAEALIKFLKYCSFYAKNHLFRVIECE